MKLLETLAPQKELPKQSELEQIPTILFIKAWEGLFPRDKKKMPSES